jgi:shikimate dehydrogenase
MAVVLSGETRLFPIIGDPIAFVQSPAWLTRGLAGRGAHAVCVPMLVPAGALAAVMQGLSAIGNVDGVLVTMPHKAAARAYCATVSPRTGRLGVVSVMRRNPDGLWHGDMLDGLAFVQAQIAAGARPAGARVLLVGAGGAGSAIALALLAAGVRDLILHDTDAGRVAQVMALLEPEDLPRVHAGPPDPAGCDMVCNATPLGMRETDPPPVGLDRLTGAMFVGDVVAGHGMTPLVRAARALGCGTADGVAMVAAVQTMMLDFMLGLGGGSDGER